jgi:hypothetical protein
VLVGGVVADVVHTDGQQAAADCAPENALAQRRFEHRRKEGENFDPQHGQFAATF